MNKTVTVNIGGIVFHIEEQAYDQLRKYLEAIKGYFTSSDGRDEIIQDIESRIAEMFSDRIGSSRQVITPDDVNFVIDALGRPEQVAGADEKDNGSNTHAGTNFIPPSAGYKRLYRDPDDKVIGGVCSGISHYIGIDPIWLRLIFLIALVLYGTGVVLYLILLVIIPKAKTTSEKLQMKGQPVNIDNIRRSIEDEVQDIKSRISGSGMARSSKGTISNFFDAIGAILSAALKFFIGFIGVILSIVLLSLMFALFIVLLAMAGIIPNAEIPMFLTHSFLDSWQLNILTTGLTLVIGIPALVLLYRIFRSLFKLKGESKYFYYGAAIIWVFGLLMSIWMGVDIGQEFREKDTHRMEIPIRQPSNDTIHLALLNPYGNNDDNYITSGWVFGDEWAVNNNHDTIRVSDVELDVQRADGNEFELIRITEGRGRSRKIAEQYTRGLTYEIEQENNVLRVADNYILPSDVKFRGQKIRLILKVPVGKSVFLGESTQDVIYDVKNVTNTYDGDMVGHTWTMTERGLECINCGFENESGSPMEKGNKGEVKIKINGKEMNVNNSDDSISLESKDIKININSDGIVIDAQDKK